jgi:hypothetical protein
VVTICASGLTLKRTPRFPHTLYLSVSYYSQIKQDLLPRIALSGWEPVMHKHYILFEVGTAFLNVI